jgi:hypothetical protein
LGEKKKLFMALVKTNSVIYRVSEAQFSQLIKIYIKISSFLVVINGGVCVCVEGIMMKISHRAKITHEQNYCTMDDDDDDKREGNC